MTKPTGNPKGRPPKPPGEALVPVCIRLPPVEAAKLRALGRDWLLPRLRKIPPIQPLK